MHGQGVLQILELLLAFGLTALVGLERHLRGKAAGLRTQSIVGVSSALILLVSKYGFDDVLVPGHVVLDPSRVAAQIVSGIGFLGAGLILTRRGTVRGLTTAAAVWESSAIGMAAGAGLWLLAVVVTGLHFVIVFGFTWLSRHLPGGGSTVVRLRITYHDGRGVLRRILAEGTTGSAWTARAVRFSEVDGHHDGQYGEQRDRRPDEQDGGHVSAIAAELDLVGQGQLDDLLARLADLPGVIDLDVVSDDELD